MTDQLKLTYFVGQNDLCGRPNRSLIGRPKILDMSNILVKNRPIDLSVTLDVRLVLFGRQQP